MHLPQRKALRRVLAPATAVIVMSGVLAAGPSAAAPGGPAADASTSTTGLVRTLSRVSSEAFPAARPQAAPLGVKTPEFQNDPREALARKRSARPTAASFDAASTAPALTAPVVASSQIAPVTQGLQTSFQGLNLFDQRSANNGNQFTVEPPDQGLCVGNGYTLEATNDVLRLFRASGAPATGVVDLNTFYGYPAQFDRTALRFGPFVTDPTCLFDQPSNRFYLVVLTLDVDPKTGAFLGSNHLDLAVSRTGDPTAGFNRYSLPAQNDGTQGTPKHAFCPCLGDYPHIGADANGVYLTTNEYSFSGAGKEGNGFNGAQIYAIAKRALARGAQQVKLVHFENTSLADGAGRVPGFTVWPATSPAANFAMADGGTEYFLSSIASRDETNGTGFANRIGVYAITGTSTLDTVTGTPSLRRALRPSEVYGVPPLAEQKQGPTPLRDCLAIECLPGFGPSSETESPLDSSDSRMQQVWYAAGHVWGALGTVVRVDGQIKTGIAYFVLDPGARPGAAQVVRQGYVALARNNVSFPSIATLANGKGVMAVNVVGQDHFPSAAFVRLNLDSTGPISLAGRGVGPQDGFSGSAFFNAPNPARPRWGDYSAAVTDGTSIWTASEYIAQSCRLPEFQADPTCGGTRTPLGNWSTRVSRITP